MNRFLSFFLFFLFIASCKIYEKELDNPNDNTANEFGGGSGSAVYYEGGSAGSPTTVIKSYTGSNQTFVVPSGVTTINFIAWGAAGGGGNSSYGGGGGFIEGDVTVVAGETLNVKVGGGGGINHSSASNPGGGGGGTPDDSLIVSITDGNSIVEVEVITANSPNLSSWQQNSFKVSDYLAPTSSMQIIFYTADLQNGNSNYVEAGVDKFQVTNSAIPPVSVVDLSEKDFILYPNPSNNFIVVKSEEIGDIEIYNLLGEKVLTSKKFTLLKEIDISVLPKGLYILKLRQTTRKFLRN